MRGPGVRARPRRRPHRAVVRALARPTSTWSTRSWTSRARGCPVIAKLEKPEAVDNLEAIVLAFDGDHGRPRRPRRRAAARAGAAGAEARDPDRPRERQAGHRRHPDARLDDRELAADPRRGLRRRQRRARRRGRGDALRRDQRRASTRSRPCSTMAQIVEAVEAGSTAVPPLNHVPRTQRGVLSYAARDIGERLDAKALVAFTAVRRHRAPARPAAHPAAAAGVHPAAGGAQPAGADLGRRDLPGADYVDTTDEMIRQVDNAMLSIGRYKRGRPRGHRRRLAARHRRARPT